MCFCTVENRPWIHYAKLSFYNDVNNKLQDASFFCRSWQIEGTKQESFCEDKLKCRIGEKWNLTCEKRRKEKQRGKKGEQIPDS